MVRAEETRMDEQRLIDDLIWPEFQALHDTLHDYLRDVTDRVIATAVHGDTSEQDVVASPAQIAP